MRGLDRISELLHFCCCQSKVNLSWGFRSRNNTYQKIINLKAAVLSPLSSMCPAVAIGNIVISIQGFSTFFRSVMIIVGVPDKYQSTTDTQMTPVPYVNEKIVLKSESQGGLHWGNMEGKILPKF